MFALDTNAAIGALNAKNEQVSVRLMRELSVGAEIVLSTIVLFELRSGIAKSTARDRNEARLIQFLRAPFIIAPFESEDADHAGEIRATLHRAGTPIGPYDVLIAAQARRLGAVLVTANRREFERVPGQVVKDWT